jgi:hypothetical protein
MMEMHIVIGGSLEDDLAGFADAWRRAERGEHVTPKRILSFQTWQTFVEHVTKPDAEAEFAAFFTTETSP